MAHHGGMIFIVVRYQVLPEKADQWVSAVESFTKKVREEPGNLWFTWSRSVEDPNEYVLIEAFRDGDAGVAHVQAPHFSEGLEAMRPLLAKTPRIINVTIPDRTDWSEMGELQIG
jgi:quinol monooxygenase YgiN